MGMGNQLPTVPDEWYPLTGSAQYLTAATSTALTLPTIAAGQPAKGAVFVGILTAMLGTMWIRFDGTTASSLIGAQPMYDGDWVVVYGYEALKAVRIVKDAAATGLMAISYFYFRKNPS